MTPGRYLSFESVAEDYDRTRVIPVAHLDEIARLMIQEAHLERGDLFLDAGVGTGRFAAPLARLCQAHVVGVDIAPAMMEHIQEKVPRQRLSLAQADLQRLPFRAGAFSGVLLVHILHLIEQWALVLQEARRVLIPRSGILFLGVEKGGRSLLVDYYYERARSRRVLASSLGTAGTAQTLAYLRRGERDGGAGAQVSLLDTPRLFWKRAAPVAQTLEALERRTFSQMWDIPDRHHQELLAETRRYALRTFRELEATEVLSAHFLLYAARWQ